MQIAPGSLPAAPASPSGVTSFPATFFASSRPNTAFDMIARVPGFTFDAGESVRGFGGAAGNVLIDGRRPASKADTLDSILQRIPASSVARIDVIRGGAPGIDMQGRTVLANVILVKAARTEVTATVAANAYSDGRLSPTVQLEAARSKGDTRLTGSVRRYEEEGGEQGSGSQVLTDGTGNLIRDARASKKDIDHGIEVRGTSQFPVLGGLADLNPSLDFTGTDQAERYAFAAPGGGIAHEAVIDTYRRKGGEIGADFSRDLSKHTQLKVVALQSLRYRTHDSSSDQDQTLTDFALKQTSGESILRATVTHQGSGAISLEAGAEGAFNFLDGNSTLRVDGAPVAIPNARARVTEKRGEAFATVTWKASSTIGVEGTAKVETSTISAHSAVRESYFFIDEIEVDRRAASLDLAWEYKPTSNWSILAQLTNVTGYQRGRFRSIYDGLRSVASLAETERFLVDRPRAFYLRVRRSL